MTRSLRASSLATVAATALAFGMPAGTFADGRGDWDGYAWQKISIAACATTGGRIVCPPYHQKWDWKRNQWVDIALSIDPDAGLVSLTQRLTNNDPKDQDYVCVVALVTDRNGQDLMAHHQNWQIGPGDVAEQPFFYEAARLDTADALFIGSKQCRNGAGQDDGVYARVLAGIAR